jgi:hypothetical protein
MDTNKHERPGILDSSSCLCVLFVVILIVNYRYLTPAFFMRMVNISKKKFEPEGFGELYKR